MRFYLDGSLVFSHTLSCVYGHAEDAREVADHEFVDGGVVRRPATHTEVSLLRAAGVDLPEDDDEVETFVAWSSPGVRRRRWFDRLGRQVVFDPHPVARTAEVHLIATAAPVAPTA
ncbi:hypothetical protein [Kineococcus aurantiacus]|uniref:Uncharacterized protein n=1 Tax=Kineococcus aurantiacus TaxID=37633 RepID=A0A7Y9DJP9_9ACTN|nr:hypothetical protein [Kineococcus aurantiacus]NYD21373.1 hypothetical protein [Kineococcus aurantiacus]